ncbi:MAG TPA: lysophospholipid acyltransferase family protein [Acetobacteraceae bacterium]|jgi:1-acyl-sn-glycerol-3-phosphate acyltransferase
MDRSPPRRLAARRPLLAERDISPPGTLLPLSGHRKNWLHPLNVLRRAGGVLLWTLPCMAIQSICLLLPGRAKVLHAKFYWSVVSRLLGVRVRMIGTPAYDKTSRPVVFVSNHSSWLDIPVVGGRLNACFVSKDEVGAWPFVGTVARLGRTVFISRQRRATARERDAMRERLAQGDNLVLFPEGTTSDGSRVLPFRSPFFAIAEGPDPPLIQPVSVVYDRLDGLPTGRASRAIFAWYGDMDLATHFWRFAQHRGLRATILLHAPMDPSGFASRKALSHAVWQAVADGAATLRQNRPIEAPATGADAGPVYA